MKNKAERDTGGGIINLYASDLHGHETQKNSKDARGTCMNEKQDGKRNEGENMYK